MIKQFKLINSLLIFFTIILMGCINNGGGSNTSLATVSFDPGSGGVANGATNVSLSPTIVLKFSVSMNPTTVNSSTVFLTTSGGILPTKKTRVAVNTSVPISNIISNSNNTIFSFSPISQLAPNTTYFVIVSDNVQTPNGNSVVGDKRFSFTTGSSAIPTVSIINPSNGATGVSLSPSIQIRFSESVLNVTPATVGLRQGSESGAVVAISSLTAGANNTYTFSPTSQLNEVSVYYVVIESGIVNLANNSLSPTSFHFITGDFTAPTVNIISPSNNAVGVSLSPSIQVQFSESVLNVVSPNVKLRQGNSESGTIISIGGIIPGANNTYTFSPSSTLSELTNYYVVLESDITDTAGNPLSRTVFNFQTGELTAPTATILTPSNNATNVTLSPSIQIKFSESVQNVESPNVSLRQGSPTGTVIPIGTIAGGPDNTYTFSPVSPLIRQTTYYVVLTNGIKDLSNNLLIPISFNFVTVPVWVNVGSVGFSAGSAAYTSLAIESTGTPYIGYRDSGNGNRATVMKYNGSSWVTVGTAGFSAGQASEVSLAISPNGTPYIGYQDSANSGRATVMRYDGIDWVIVGNPGFSAGQNFFTSLAIAPDGTPYIGYQDGGTGGRATVMKFDGFAWVPVGNLGLSAGQAPYTSLVIESTGTPYIGYQDVANGQKATVMKYDGINWVAVGSAGFSAGQALYTSLAIESTGTLYIGYRDVANGNRTTVMKYNGSNWTNVGSPGFSAGATSYVSLVIAPDGTSYIGYRDEANGFRATVMKYNGSNWVNVGSPGFSAGVVIYTSLAINPNGIPYIGYGDNANGQRATVMNAPSP